MEKLKFDIQRFDTDAGAEVKKVALEVLNVFGQIVINLGLKKLAEELDKAQDATEWLKKNANPVLSFLGSTKFGKSFGNYAKLITNSIKIIDNTLSIVKDDLPDATRNSKIVSVAASLESMASATAKLSKDKDSAGVLSIVSGIISLTASLISGMDGITESEQEKINSSYISFMRTLGSDILKKVFAEAFDEADDSINNLLKQGKFFTSAAPVFLKTFNGIMTFGGGILNGYNKYNNNLEKYLDDGIPEEIAKHDAFIDAIAKFAKETMSGIVFGVDDLIFDVAKWITSGLGIEYAEDENKDYIETLFYKTPLKKLNYTNTGLSTDDTILYVLENSTMVYGDDGNDAIDNFGFSNATIWGGHDNDTIHSYKTDSATPQENSIFGGPGNDQIVVYDKLSTVYGGKGNDSIMVLGTNNVIYGNAGNDSIYVYKDANENAVSGGTGDDKIILLEGTKNALIKYNEGDGNDIIYYFDEDDAIKISGSYKISTNDTDVKINVGNGSMLLVGAAGKNIKINGRIITNSDADDNTLSSGTITLPNVPTMPETVKTPFVYGTDNNDTIYNYKYNVLINAGLGNDTVYNEGYNVTINGGAGNDSICNENGGKDVNIIGNSGDDYIYNYWGNSNVMIDSGIANDYISNYGANATIDAGDGTDTIYNEGYTVSINGGKGNDNIKNNYCSNVTIDGGAGNDSIYNYKYGSYVTINGGAGSDYIYNQENLIFTSNNVENSGRFVTINGGEDNDSIDNFGSNVSINGGAGNDSIYNHGPDTNIASLYRTKSPSYVTINGGAGNDVIISHSYGDGILIEYKNGDGNDTISGLGFNGTLKITGAKYSTLKSGNNIKIIVGNGSMLLENKSSIDFTIDGILGEVPSVNNSSNNIEIRGTEGDDTIANSGSNVTINGGLRNDSIYNEGSNVTINASEGDDEIKNIGDSVTVNAGNENDSIENEGDSVTINAGAGDDYISNDGDSVTIDAGVGDDDIENEGDSVTINAGAGDDYISNDGDSVTIDAGVGNDFLNLYSSSKNILIQYKNGDGNDTIYGLDEDDTLQISGAKYSTVKSGNDIKIIVGDGSILLENKSSIDFTIDGTLGSGTDTTPADTLPTGISISNSVLTVSNNFTGNKIDLSDYPSAIKVNVSALSQGVSIIGSSASNSIKGGSGADTISGGAGNDTVSFGGGADVYIYSSGNDLIQDYTAGQDKIKLSSGSISSVSISSSDVVLNVSTGGKITIQNGKDKEITFIDSNGRENKKVYPVKEDTIPADTLPTGISISNSVLTASTAFTGNKIDLTDYPTATKVNAAELSRGISIVGTGSSNSIKGGSGADTIISGAGNDTVSLGGGADVYIYSSGNDLIQDYVPREDKIRLSKGTISSASVSNSNVILNISTGGKITIQNGKDKEITFIDSNGKEFKQVYPANDNPELNDSLPAGTSVKSSVLTATNKFTGNKIDLANYPTVTKINASTVSQSVNIVGNSSANSLKGGKGADTISGGSGNDTLTGGTGKDLFVYSSGNDVITDYKVGEDKIKIGTITKSSVKGLDVILTTSNGTLTVKGAKDKVVAFIDNAGKTTDKIFFADTSYAPLATGLSYDAKRTVLTASNKFTDNEIDLGEYLGTVAKVNASALSKGAEIVGNTSNNSLKGGKGADTISGGLGKDTIIGGAGTDVINGGADNDILKGDAGNDTLNGDAGNDTLTGGAGNDVFVYEGGNDVITDYATGQNTIKLATGTIINSSLKSSDIILTTANGSITVKNGKDKKITVTDGNGNTTTEVYGRFNYNGDKSSITLASTFTGSLKSADYASSVKTINATSVTKSSNIIGNTQNNTIIGGSAAEIISGGTGNDSIIGNSGNDKIYGDAGADTLNGGKGNDTLTGGNGADVFFYSSGEGNDVIVDFTAGQDSINLTNGTIASASLKSSDMVFKIGSGTLTVKNGKNQEIVIGNSIYYNNLVYDKNKSVITIGAGFSGSLKSSDYVTTVKTINAGGVTKSTNIIGNAQDNTIIGSSKAETIYGGVGNDSIIGNAGNDKIYGDAGNDKLLGGEGNDSLYGGTGNDTLTGEKGNDVFVYEGGNDVITDYAAGQDKIKISSGKVTKTGYNGNAVTFTVGSGSITVQNGKGKKITIIDANNKTTTQTYTQDVSYKAASNARWFTADDNNFITDEIQISDIAKIQESNYSAIQANVVENKNELAITDAVFSAISSDKK